MTREQLKQEIESAFDEVPYPGDHRLVAPSEFYDLERERIVADFRGRDWRHVPNQILFFHHDSLPFLSPEAFRYYLPVYLLAAVFHYENSNMIPDSVIYSLIPPSELHEDKSGEDWEKFGAAWEDSYWCRVNGFTSAQRQAILSYLRFMKQEHGTDDIMGYLDKAITAMERL